MWLQQQQKSHQINRTNSKPFLPNKTADKKYNANIVKINSGLVFFFSRRSLRCEIEIKFRLSYKYTLIIELTTNHDQRVIYVRRSQTTKSQWTERCICFCFYAYLSLHTSPSNCVSQSSTMCTFAYVVVCLLCSSYEESKATFVSLSVVGLNVACTKYSHALCNSFSFDL